MTEQERLIVVERIKKDLELQKEREQKRNKLEELKQNEAVREYLRVSNEIRKLSKELSFLKTKEDAIYWEFLWAFYSKVKSEGFSPCNHDIWMYIGSYGWEDYGFFEGHDYIIEDENREDFYVNKYKCLECGICKNVTDWNKFEEDNFVLKNRKDSNVQQYMDLYYHLLYNHTIEESQRMLIEEFNKNKVLVKKKIK